MLGLVEQVSQQVQTAAPQTGHAPPANDPGSDFVRAILGDTEDVWGDLFQRGGKTYQRPKLILFTGSVASACGTASSAAGPFYCPGDRQVYLDLDFFGEMKQHLGGGGDFAQAYVIAHEVGHHVQNLLGISAQIDRARQRGENFKGAEGLSVRQELQADCFAGVWAHAAQQRHQWLDAGDIETALNTATAIGDDQLQRQARGTVMPDSFTHGSSEQRVRWFKAGFDSGSIGQCDTFKAAQL
jgi:predicted metalloprotease